MKLIANSINSTEIKTKIAFFLLNIMPEIPIKKVIVGIMIKVRRSILYRIILVFRL